MRTMYWLGVESRMIFMCSMTSLNGAMSFMRSWLVMVAGTVRMHTMALRRTSSVSDVILLRPGWTKKRAFYIHKKIDLFISAVLVVIK